MAFNEAKTRARGKFLTTETTFCGSCPRRNPTNSNAFEWIF
jgi:hypothetical protein